MIFPVIVCIAKHESKYIEEWVKYHFALGFHHIYLYDNEDIPTYAKLLEPYKDKMTIIHCPGNNYSIPVQFHILTHFNYNFKHLDSITHIIHLDIDEFIVLKKHNNITEFINEYIKDDCTGIAINWRYFGSSNQTEELDLPVTQRFTLCGEKLDKHIKTIFTKHNFYWWWTAHNIKTAPGYHVKSTNGDIVLTAFNHNPDNSVIQINHYKSKTWSEFSKIRSVRKRPDVFDTGIDVEAIFNIVNQNDVEDLGAYNFYRKNCM